MNNQFSFFLQDINRIINKRYYRVIIIFFLRSFWGVFLYRIERQFFILFGKYYRIIRLPFLPIISILQSFSNIDIHYKANIKGGISILHPSLGIVISGKVNVGNSLTLTGGNVIGFNKKSNNKIFNIGNNCNLGANAVIIGPIILGNDIVIGACACVTKNFETNFSILVGVPAKSIN